MFGSQRCDCGPQPREAVERDHSVAAQMLQALGAGRIRLLSGNPDKARQFDALGVRVVGRVPTGVHLAAKVSRTHHPIALPV